MSVCSKFSELYFHQMLFELVYSWESYHKKRMNFLLRHIAVTFYRVYLSSVVLLDKIIIVIISIRA